MAVAARSSRRRIRPYPGRRPEEPRRHALTRLRARSLRGGLEVETLHADFFALECRTPYDAVALNFFLNLFAPRRMCRALAHAAALLRPGGVLLIADFAPARAGAFGRLLAAFSYRPLAAVAAALGLCAPHPIYDCAKCARDLGLRVEKRERFGILAGLYESMLARRPR